MRIKKSISFFLVTVSIFSFADLPYIKTDLLPNIEEMDESVDTFSQLAEAKIDLFVKSSNLKKYDEAYEAWSSLCDSFFQLQLLFYQTVILTPNLIIKGFAGSNLIELHGLFRKSLREKKVLDVFRKNGLEAALLSPFQRDLTKNVLEGAQSSSTESLEELMKFERSNFIYQASKLNKKRGVGNRLRVLTANILCFPGELTYFFGGLPPWKARIDQISDKIKSTKADIICLQEVFDKEVARKLIEKLQDRYTYFIYDAGNQYGTINPEELGFNSGLFVASKTPIDEICFTPFETTRPLKGGVKRGAIHLKFKAGNSEWTLVSTHLQPGIDKSSEEIRESQFLECANLLKNKRGFILGDFNINAFSPEFNSSILSKEFRIPYLDHKTSLSKSTATATDYFNDLTHTQISERKKVVPTYEILDYCVMSKEDKTLKLLSQERVQFFKIEDPNGALSDHHGILTVWKEQ